MRAAEALEYLPSSSGILLTPEGHNQPTPKRNETKKASRNKHGNARPRNSPKSDKIPEDLPNDSRIPCSLKI